MFYKITNKDRKEDYNNLDKPDFITFISPWVLPNEEIPLHLNWEKDFSFEQVEILFPEDLNFVESININCLEFKNSKILIKKQDIRVFKQILDFPNFFGLIFKNANIEFKKLVLFHEIKISFIENDKVVEEIILIAKIFRPVLFNNSQLEKIILSDENKEYNVSLNLILKGFGFVSTSIEVIINRIKISFDESAVKKVYEKLKKKYKSFLKSEDNKAKNIIEITEESINKFKVMLQDYIAKEESENGKITSLVEQFDKENINILLIIDFIVELIKESKIRQKFENILLKNPFIEIPKEKFNEFIDSIQILIHYEDLIGNIYEPLVIPLDIIDYRTDPQEFIINFKIEINNIENKTFYEVDKLERD